MIVSSIVVCDYCKLKIEPREIIAILAHSPTERSHYHNRFIKDMSHPDGDCYLKHLMLVQQKRRLAENKLPK